MSKQSRFGSGLVLLTGAICLLSALPAVAASQARIVRLSDVQGSVQIDKNTGIGFESAFVNLPITQGTQLKTGANGRAEIEFEDGSSLRLAPHTVAEFGTLGLNDAGKRISVVTVVEGMAYVNWLGSSSDQFSLNFSRENVALDHASHFRVQASDEIAKLSVYKGAIEVQTPSGKTLVEKKKTASFDGADNDKATLANNIEEAPLDTWDKEAISYHDQYAKNNSTPLGYGSSDMNYYGAYSNVPGYGTMWQPYFTGVGWDPFMNGAWGWYPGMGYMFASSYPWGWTPYHYGNWMFVPGFGWMWQPGGWSSWSTAPRYAGTVPANFHPLVAPPTGTVKTVFVGRGGPIASPTSRLIVNAGSAGMGIPRGSVENLSHLNHQVAKSGFAEVRPSPSFSGYSGRPSVASSSSSATSSRGTSMSAPAVHSSAPSHASSGSHH